MNTEELINFFEKGYNKKINDFYYEWNEISEFKYLTEAFIDKYKDEVDWYLISYCQNLSEKFIEKYQKKVKWFYISKYQKLSGDFINKFKDKITFTHISKQNKINYLQYKVKNNIISNSEYLKKILKLK